MGVSWGNGGYEGVSVHVCARECIPLLSTHACSQCVCVCLSIWETHKCEYQPGLYFRSTTIMYPESHQCRRTGLLCFWSVKAELPTIGLYFIYLPRVFMVLGVRRTINSHVVAIKLNLSYLTYRQGPWPQTMIQVPCYFFQDNVIQCTICDLSNV
jgi:hypothetical protein